MHTLNSVRGEEEQILGANYGNDKEMLQFEKQKFTLLAKMILRHHPSVMSLYRVT